MKKRILLTYAMYGNGHRAIAEYIESYFKSQDPELEILAIDLLKYSTPVLGRLSQKVTDFFLLKFPFGWSIIYNLFTLFIPFYPFIVLGCKVRVMVLQIRITRINNNLRWYLRFVAKSGSVLYWITHPE